MSSDWRRLPWRARYRLGGYVGSHLRRVTVWATHRHCTVEIGAGTYLGPGFSLSIPDRGQLVIGPGVDFRRGFVCEIAGTGRVTIGERSIFTSHALIQCTTTIDIGPGCVFSQALLIADGNHRFRDWRVPMVQQGYDFRPVHIGEGASVFAKCTVLNDIGRGAVIGANSVVAKPIPPYCLAAGAPAKVIEYFGPRDQRPPDILDARDPAIRTEHDTVTGE